MTNAGNVEPRNEALRKLTLASEDVRAAKARYLAEQEASWQRYVETIEHALAEDLRVDPDPTPGPDPVHQLLDEVRGRLDDLRVRARLGRMELDDLAAELRDATSKVVDLLRP